MYTAGSSEERGAGVARPTILTAAQQYRVPVGGEAVLECRVDRLGDSVQLWKNGTRVISVGTLQVTCGYINSLAEILRIDWERPAELRAAILNRIDHNIKHC